MHSPSARNQNPINFAAVKPTTENQSLTRDLSNRASPSEKGNAVPASPRNGVKFPEKAGAFGGGDCRSADSPSSALREIARDVRRIHDPLRANPEAVYEAKDAIAARLMRLADAMEARHV